MIKVISQYVPKAPFTVCVSSGVDSIAAAHWLKHNYHKEFNIIHFNHGYQDINTEMEEKVAQFAKAFTIECLYSYRPPWITDNSENGLREWRLSEMRKIGGKYVTAHHLNDCVENYLMNCFHGTPEYKPIQEFTQFNGFSIYHPFLTTTKEDFIRYAIKNDLMKYVVEDPTNKEVTQKRNWIRNVIVPELDAWEMGLQTIVKKKFYNNLIKTELQ